MITSTKSCRRWLAALATSMAALGMVHDARATVLAYEGFDYTAGSLLVNAGVGLNGGTGFAGAWDETQGVSDATQVQAGSLGYTDALGNVLTTTGGKLQNTGEFGTNNQPGRTFAFRRHGATLGATVNAPAETWLSFLGVRQGELNDFVEGSIENFTYGRGANLTLFDMTAAGPEKLNFGENSGFHFPYVDGTDFLKIQRTDVSLIETWKQQFGKSGTLAMVAEDRWQINAPQVNGNVTAQAMPNYNDPEDGIITTAREWQENPVDGRFRARFTQTAFAGQASLILVRVDHYGGDTPRDKVFVWMNPSLNEEPTSATANAVLDLASIETRATELGQAAFQTADGNLFSFDRLRLFAGNTAGARHHADWLIDEIRIGTGFADVTPHGAAMAAPEPGSLTMALAAVALGCAARRRRPA
jgi:hypothetical protein